MATTVPLCLPFHPVKPVKRQVGCLPECEFNLPVYCRHTAKGKTKWGLAQNPRACSCIKSQAMLFQTASSSKHICSVFLLACHDVSRIDLYLFARLHCQQTAKKIKKIKTM